MIRNGILLLALAFTGAAREPFTTSDWWRWRTVETPQIDPEGQRLVYIQSWRDLPSRAEWRNLWTVAADGRGPRSLAEGKWHDWSPRWSADGTRVAYLSDRDGAVRIRIHHIGTGKDDVLAAPEGRIQSLGWSPDGKSIAFTVAIAARQQAAWLPPSLLPQLSPAPLEMHLFLAPVTGGATQRLSGGDFSIRGEPMWMPDGQWILNAAAHPMEDTEIYGIHVPDGEVRQLTHHAGPDDSPLPSPDGSKIAWIAAEPQPAGYAVRKLWVMGRDGEHMKVLTGRLDRDVASPQWSSDSRTVYFLAEDRGASHVYAARSDGTVRQATNRPERLTGLSLADSGRAVTVRSTATEAGNLVSFAVDLPGGVTTLVAPNEPLLADRDMATAEEIAYDSGGQAIQAWVVKPPRFDASRKYPLIVDIQDAPHLMYGPEISLRSQILAAQGYLVLCANPRGTPGYGEVFGNLLRSRFPGDDFDDLMKGVDHLLSKGSVDSARMMVAGGLLAAWAIGHTPRFAAAAVERPIVDWTVDVLLSPEGHRHAAWMGAMPWEDPDQYVKHSPIYFARDFKTPTLVLAEANDPQSQELLSALRARKVESSLVHLPTADDPSALEATLAWFAKFGVSRTNP